MFLWKCPWAYIGLPQNLKKFWTWTQNFEKGSSELCIPSVKHLLELVWYLNPNCHLRYIAWISPWQIPEMEIAGSLFSNILPIGSGYAELGHLSIKPWSVDKQDFLRLFSRMYTNLTQWKSFPDLCCYTQVAMSRERMIFHENYNTANKLCGTAF